MIGVKITFMMLKKSKNDNANVLEKDEEQESIKKNEQEFQKNYIRFSFYATIVLLHVSSEH